MNLSAPPTAPVAWWGAALATVLALIKVWELWRDRFRLDVSYNFSGLSSIGNKVLIRNIGSRPLILTHWDLLYGSRRWPFRRFEHLASADFEEGDTTIEAGDTHTLHFDEQDHFDWGASALRGRSIYIRLFVAGRRPRIRRVFRHSA
jgi:hypothetical protein